MWNIIVCITIISVSTSVHFDCMVCQHRRAKLILTSYLPPLLSQTGEDLDPDLVERNLSFLREMNIPKPLKYATALALMPIWKFYYYAPNSECSYYALLSFLCCFHLKDDSNCILIYVLTFSIYSLQRVASCLI
jgi:hypothetical protein